MGSGSSTDGKKAEVVGNRSEPDVILTVFWCGTGGTIKGMTTQVGLFYSQCQATDSSLLDAGPPPRHIKIGFDGCGVTNGTGGTVFALGLTEQCETVVQVLTSLLEKVQNVRVNCLGLSRGGMACLLLAKLLVTKHVDPSRVELNLLLFDPVPGNGISSVAVDVFGWSIASTCMDLRQCVHLNQVVAIYPHEPLPAFAFHAPILPRYPAHAQVEEDVWLGCHQGALQPRLHFLESKMSYYRIREFLTNLGSPISPELELTAPTLLANMDFVLNHQVTAATATSRSTHSFTSTIIIRKSGGRYLNKFHRRLASNSRSDEQAATDAELVLTLQRVCNLSGKGGQYEHKTS